MMDERNKREAKNMLIIGICGASGSGKSTLAEELVKKINKPAVLINQDAYYRDHAYLPFGNEYILLPPPFWHVFLPTPTAFRLYRMR